MASSGEKFTKLGEIQPGQLWAPTSLDEWIKREEARHRLRSEAFQLEQERSLRSRCATLIFWLAALQSAGGFVILFLVGLGCLEFTGNTLTLIFSGLLAEIFGLLFVVTRFLFSRSNSA